MPSIQRQIGGNSLDFVNSTKALAIASLLAAIWLSFPRRSSFGPSFKPWLMSHVGQRARHPFGFRLELPDRVLEERVQELKREADRAGVQKNKAKQARINEQISNLNRAMDTSNGKLKFGAN